MMKSIPQIMIIIGLLGCNSATEKVKSQDEFDLFEIESINLKTDTNETHLNNEDGPPFSDSCLCNFETIGEFRTNDIRYDLVLSGKGWNPKYWSCSWIWGEIINNEFPPDSLVTDFRIHLVDLEKIDFNTFMSKNFKENVIATYSHLPNDDFMTCKFDPYKTGKYPKPEQWVE